ncbi:DUF6965 family protein [Flavobacterium humidisoli]|uniref:DUF6965 domain-containing protein n=1 Tax=Flavobacterium humidisoli TaxID=2937442 RepID=A0ABY4M0D4_9FLAO|nr:hypothetical protein [Flavobacterium humidisoli]UPZ17924.1 hypothetical protein M0M44_11385 [Flavobacterium humidisoli]
MNYEDIKRHFENHPPPKEVQWTPWAKIADTQAFLKSCHTTIRNFNGTMDRCPAWWHLRDFYILMKKTAQQPSDGHTGQQAPSEETGLQAGSETEEAV